MRIAVLIDTWFPFIGGGQINAWEISKRLAKGGVQVEIVTRSGGKDNLGKIANLKVIKLGSNSKPNDEFSRFKYLFQSLVYCTRNGHDLIVAHAFLPGLVAKMFMILKNKPAILVVHGTSIGTDLNKGFKAQLEKFILTKIKYSAQITVSQDFLNIKNVNKKISYIPNGVDPIFLKSIRSPKRLKNTLLFVGRLHPQKNLKNLIEAIKILNDENYPVKLKIVGDGPQKREILDLIRKHKLQKQITLEGQKTKRQLISYYKTSTALILPSIYEGQPLTLLEAWACRLPVIVANTGDNSYIVRDGANGFLIKNRQDQNGISQAIKIALKSKNLEKIGTAGYTFAIKNFSWDKSTQESLKIYEKITKAQG